MTHPAESRSAVPAVALRGLRKSFGSKAAVRGMDLDIPAGCFFGLVGPNGAGKTTTLRMATALLRPDSGGAWIGGIDVWANPVAIKRMIGVLPEDLRLFERLTGIELLTYTGLLRGLPSELVLARATELLEVLGLSDAAQTMVVDYSHGMRKKIGLAAALLHGPQVLFLDEPFEAIDPVSSLTIRAVLERLTMSGATVVFSSHVMDLVERLCDRLAVIHQGVVVAQGPTATVCGERHLEDVFVDLIGGARASSGLEWLDSSSN